MWTCRHRLYRSGQEFCVLLWRDGPEEEAGQDLGPWVERRRWTGWDILRSCRRFHLQNQHLEDREEIITPGQILCRHSARLRLLAHRTGPLVA